MRPDLGEQRLISLLVRLGEELDGMRETTHERYPRRPSQQLGRQPAIGSRGRGRLDPSPGLAWDGVGAQEPIEDTQDLQWRRQLT